MYSRTIVLLLLVSAPVAFAAPPTVAESADQVRQAHATESPKDLRALALRSLPDPWLVVELLCSTGDYDAAVAFVRAAPRNDTSTLPEQIEALRKAPPSTQDRRALARALAAAPGEEAVKLLDGITVGDPGVWATRVALARAQVEGTAEAWTRAALTARTVGWLQAAARSYRNAARAEEQSDANSRALVAARARLAVETLRGADAALDSALAEAGRLALALNELPEAEDLLRRALRQAERSRDPAVKARVQDLLGRTLARSGAQQDALVYLRRAQQAYRESEEIARVLDIEEALVTLEASTGGIEKGMARAESALRMARELKNQIAEARMLAALARMEEQRKDWVAAVTRFDGAEAVFRTAGDERSAGECAYRSGRLLRRMGRLGLAREALRRAAKDASETKADDLQAHVQATLGTVELERGERKAAAKHLTAAARLAEAAKNTELAAQTLARAARLDVEFGKPKEARAKLKQALPVLRNLNEPNDLVDALLTQSQVETADGEGEAAQAYIDEVLAVARRDVMPGAIARGLAGSARVDLLGDDPASARTAFEKVRAGAREALTALERAGHKTTPRFESALEYLLAVGVDAALAANDAALLLTVGEYRRSRRMLRDLGGRDALLRALTPLSIQRSQEQVRKREEAALAEYQRQRERMDKNAMLAARDTVKAARAELAKLQKAVEASVEGARALLAPEITVLKDVRDALATSETLLYFCVGVDHVGALIVTRESVRLLRVGPRETIEQGVNSFMRDEAGFKSSDPAIAIAKIRQSLYVPLAIAEVQHDLVVSPVSPLDRIPFCLLDSDLTVRYVDSAASIVTAAKAGTQLGTGILGVGNTNFADGSVRIRLTHLRNGIPIRRLETGRRLAADFKDAVVVGPPGTEAAFRAMLVTRPRWHAIHFAVPVLLDGQRPYASLFGLAPGDGEDGTLDLFDMMRLGLRSEVTLLAACEPAKGIVDSGAGLRGVARGIQLAGSARVVISQWWTDDEAAGELMSQFYKFWNNGQTSVPLALRRAQEKVTERAGWQHPKYWAGWQVWGAR